MGPSCGFRANVGGDANGEEVMDILEGKVAVVTGASRGIGRGAAIG